MKQHMTCKTCKDRGFEKCVCWNKTPPCVQVKADDTDSKKLMKDFIRDQRKQACREMIEYIEKQVPEYNPEIDNAPEYPEYMDAIAWAEEYLKKMP